VETSDNFAARMHWSTYRASETDILVDEYGYSPSETALRRHGSWREDLNVELINPFTRNIALSWSQVFEKDLLASFESGAMAAIKKLLKDVEMSAPFGLQDRSRSQGEVCLDGANLTMRLMMDVVSEALNTQQKEISRCLAPHVQNELVPGYGAAMEEHGRGSVARQKVSEQLHLRLVHQLTSRVAGMFPRIYLGLQG
jgi:hypothetical protein